MALIDVVHVASKPDLNGNGNKNEEEEEQEEEEEEEEDFNPFLKGTPSREASSSLSSEVEGFEGESVKNPTNEEQNHDVGDLNHGEEIAMASGVELESEKEVGNSCNRRCKKKNSGSGSNVEDGNERGEENGVSKEVLNVVDDEDAICKRTRARYSLAGFTLDELETFLQETDDEDDLPNVDDEEEYRKFLTAVLHGRDGDCQSNQENENFDDDDEDNDADFEIELEELLESDVDDGTKDKCQKIEYERGGRRPETRQKKRQRASAEYNKKLLEQAKRPLRPLLPIVPGGFISSFPTASDKALAPKASPSYVSSAECGLINGFTQQQIGQLHCLISEHVQLLIQVFSLCIFDSSRQHLASQVQGLIFEMLQKRDEVIACKSVPYPGICFRPPYLCPSVSDSLPVIPPAQCASQSTPALNLQMSVSQNATLPQGRDGHAFIEQMSPSQTADSYWMPFINGPIISILDVAPLTLVGRYMDDVYNAVQDYRQRYLNSSSDTWSEKEPLFYLPPSSLQCEANGEVQRGNISPVVGTVPSSSGQQPPKKTLAASIVESTKKQSIALVPKDISKLAERFFPLFNPAMFPHKPPPAAVANRVLFTDAEDELLALGIMEYNTDWKAIQLRFLPCKTKHQIFVRQKNRVSSKAPENTIKAVRRMKTSPLTAEEVERIQEGLRVYKLDWLSVWKFVVPYRDPSLLPRQLRIALGTQKSYKLDAVTKERRRISETKKRAADLANWQVASDKKHNQIDATGGGNSSGDDCVDNTNEAYVHQAFLSDWRPGSLISGETLSREGPTIKEHLNNCGPGDAQPWTNNMHGFPYGSSSHQYHLAHVKPCSNTTVPNYRISNMSLNISKSQIHLRPYQCRRTDGSRLVKLAPDLPPVNLPPSVRIISQSEFKNSQCGSSVKVSVLGSRTGDSGKAKIHSQLPHVGTLITSSSVESKRDKNNQAADNVADSNLEESAVVDNVFIAEERGVDSDLQMHPLLFQAPEGGRPPYFPLNCNSGTSSSFSFFSGNQPQLNLSLFHNPHQANHAVHSFNRSSKTKDFTSTSCGIDFHPLLQRTEEENSNLVMPCSNPNPSFCLRGESSQFQNHFDVVQNKSLASHGPFTLGSRDTSKEKANDLDLEIHLSSNSAKDVSEGSRDGGLDNQPRSTVSEPTSGRRIGTCKINSPQHQNSKHHPTVHSNLVSGADASPVPITNVSICDMYDIDELSHPEIVMEQEELSDSNEENEESVEFECEEMDDSEGEEGAGCEAAAEVHDKEAPSVAMEEVTTSEDFGDQCCEVRSPVHPGRPSILGKSSPSKLSLTTLGKETTRNSSLGKATTSSSWLSLDSHAIDEVPAAKILASSRPNRLCKKMTPIPKVETHKDASNMAQQLSLVPLAVSTLRKPRKRTYRANSNLGTGTAAKNDQEKFG